MLWLWSGYLVWSSLVNICDARIREMVGAHLLRFAGGRENQGARKTEQDYG